LILYVENNYLTAYLAYKEMEPYRLVKYSLAILNSKSEETHVMIFERANLWTGWGNDFCLKSKLLENAEEYLPGNVLTIVLHVSFY
jgi:hypothetical protein